MQLFARSASSLARSLVDSMAKACVILSSPGWHAFAAIKASASSSSCVAVEGRTFVGGVVRRRQNRRRAKALQVQRHRVVRVRAQRRVDVFDHGVLASSAADHRFRHAEIEGRGLLRPEDVHREPRRRDERGSATRDGPRAAALGPHQRTFIRSVARGDGDGGSES